MLTKKVWPVGRPWGRLLVLSSVLSSVVALALSSGCSSLRFPGVYRIPILQGNIIDQKKVDQLALGMDKRQVQYVMGTPLIRDAFHADRWDYIYQVRRGGDKLRDRRFSVYFEGDKLVRYEGDYQPEAATLEAGEVQPLPREIKEDQDFYIEDAQQL